MITRILGAGLVGLGLGLAIISSQPEVEDSRFSSIIRLHDSTGRFFCSAVVISDKYALTAGHCIQQSIGMFNLGLSTEPIRIYLENGNPSFTWAMPLAANSRADVGVLVGDFTNFKKSEVETNSVKVYEAFTDKVKSCGFPWGGSLTCFEMKQLGKYYFYYTATDGSLYPGTSGGPVFNKDGKVVGVNSAVSENANVLAPIVELEAMLRIKLK